jgi:acyl-[acyl-carrier-protein]-phospholipid O-acyltransferase/long-chain-fatty-acid--[acyl-carrier-protein] ligase
MNVIHKKGFVMILHHQFIDSAKKYGRKVAVIDTATQKTYTYNQLLIAALIFANKLKHFPEKHIGIMIPSSAGCIISILGTQLAGKTPVMINFSTGAAQNTEYAQLKCSFLTFITSKKLSSLDGTIRLFNRHTNIIVVYNIHESIPELIY